MVTDHVKDLKKFVNSATQHIIASITKNKPSCLIATHFSSVEDAPISCGWIAPQYLQKRLSGAIRSLQLEQNVADSSASILIGKLSNIQFLTKFVRLNG